MRWDQQTSKGHSTRTLYIGNDPRISASRKVVIDMGFLCEYLAHSLQRRPLLNIFLTRCLMKSKYLKGIHCCITFFVSCKVICSCVCCVKVLMEVILLVSYFLLTGWQFHNPEQNLHIGWLFFARLSINRSASNPIRFSFFLNSVFWHKNIPQP